MKKLYRYVPLLMISALGCTSIEQSYWCCDHTENAARLVYNHPDSHLKLEFLKLPSETMEVFVFLDQYQFTPSSFDPSLTEVSFLVNEQEITESVPLRIGKMKVKLSAQTGRELINGLKNQKKIVMMTEGFKEQLIPDAFEIAYAKFSSGNNHSILHSIKGPLQ